MNLWMTALMSFVVSASSADGYNILVMMPFSAKSHQIALQPVAEELAKRGHNVTIASSVKASAEQLKPGIERVHLPLAENVLDTHQFSFFSGDFSDSRVREAFLNLLKGTVTATYDEPFVRDLVLNPRDKQTGHPRHDVLIVDVVFNEFTLPLAHHMGVPSIYFAPAAVPPSIKIALGIPAPLSYLPITSVFIPGQMTFVQRANNFLQSTLFDIFRSWMMHPFYDEVIAKHLPKSPSMFVLESNVSLLLQNSKLPLAPSAPSMPYFIEVGCLHCVPAKKLPKDLEDFMQSSGEAGVIYFSLGSYTKGTSMPQEMRDKVLKAFARFPQKILWKFEEAIENLPKNIKLVKWAPQQDILGHPKTRLFISHGGGLSTHEAGYHACPILAFPLSADQLGNIATAVSVGLCEYLDWKTFTADDLFSKITLMLGSQEYKKSALKVSELLRDSNEQPAPTAAYWIEYVIRHRGAAHLKSKGDNLNFFQYFLLDVIGAALLAILLLLGICIYVLRMIIRLFRKPSAVLQKKQKKS